jgi:hypothetical protein
MGYNLNEGIGKEVKRFIPEAGFRIKVVNGLKP